MNNRFYWKKSIEESKELSEDKNEIISSEITSNKELIKLNI